MVKGQSTGVPNISVKSSQSVAVCPQCVPCVLVPVIRSPDTPTCILILVALVFSYGFVCEALSNSEFFAPSIPRHNVGIRALLCLFFICFFIALLLHQSVTVRDFGILLPRGRSMAQKLYNQLIITIYTRNTSHSSNGTLNFV